MTDKEFALVFVCIYVYMYHLIHWAVHEVCWIVTYLPGRWTIHLQHFQGWLFLQKSSYGLSIFSKVIPSLSNYLGIGGCEVASYAERDMEGYTRSEESIDNQEKDSGFEMSRTPERSKVSRVPTLSAPRKRGRATLRKVHTLSGVQICGRLSRNSIALQQHMKLAYHFLVSSLRPCFSVFRTVLP